MLTYKSLSKYLTATTVLLIISCSNRIEEVSEPLPKTPDTAQPTTTSTYPVNNELNASTDTVISVTFSEEIDESSITLENVKIYQVPANGPLLPIDIEPKSFIYNVSNYTLNLRLLQTLEFDTRYRVEIKADPLTNNGIKDLAGNLLETNEEGKFAWNFTSKENLPLAIKSVIPRSTATNIDPKSDIQIVFDSRYLPTDVSIDPNIINVTLNNGQTIDGTFNYDTTNHTATFTPTRNMPFKQVIDISVNVDSSTNSNIANHKWSFPIREGKILAGTATMIEANMNNIWGGYNLLNSEMEYPETTHFQSLVDHIGNTTVIWRQSFSRGEPQLWVNRYDHRSGWNTDENGNNAGTSISPKYNGQYIRTIKSVVDPFGNITVAWLVEKSSSGFRDLWANHYDIKTGWQKNATGEITATKLEDDDVNWVEGFDMVSDPSGNITIVFGQQFIYANRFNNGTKKWETFLNSNNIATKLDVNGLSIGNEKGLSPNRPPTLIIDNVGNVTVVWARKFLSGYALESTRYNVGSGWNPRSERIESQIDGGPIYDINLAVDPKNNITVSWQQVEADSVNGDHINLWANSFIPNRGWQIDSTGNSSPTLLDSALNNVTSPLQVVQTRLKADSLGNVHVMWQKNAAIWSSQLSALTNTWSTAKELDPLGWGQLLTNSEFIADNDGNMSLVWLTNSGVYTKRYDAIQDWQQSERLDTGNDNLNAVSLSANSDVLGNINITWLQPTQSSTANSVWYNRFNNTTKTWYKDANSIINSHVIESENFTPASHNRMVVDDQGNLMVTWLQSDGNNVSIYANRFEVDTSSWWTNAAGEISGVVIETATGVDIPSQQYSFYSPEPFMDRNGSATIIWIQYNFDSLSGFDLWANRYE